MNYFSILYSTANRRGKKGLEASAGVFPKSDFKYTVPSQVKAGASEIKIEDATFFYKARTKGLRVESAVLLTEGIKQLFVRAPWKAPLHEMP